MPVLDFSLAPNESVISEAGALFFFQAEDGIQDTSVTGVQTCALPIWGRTQAHDRAREHRLAGPRLADHTQRPAPVDREAHPVHRPDQPTGGAELGLQVAHVEERPRSEERRVGREWRSRGWRCCLTVSG